MCRIRIWWYVSTDNGSDDNNGSEHTLCYIQKAINNANEQDVIHVEAGHYIENLVFNGKNISLFGEDPHNTFVREQIIITCHQIMEF